LTKNINKLKFACFKSRLLANSNDDDDVHLNENLMNFVTEGLKFHKDLIKETCSHALPYDPSAANDVYRNYQSQTTSIKYGNGPRPKAKPAHLMPIQSAINNQLVPFKTIVSVPTKPAKFTVPHMFVSLDNTHERNERDSDLFASSLSTYSNVSDSFNQQNQTENSDKTFFITEDPRASTNLQTSENVKKNDWDDFVISKLSENTAKWIVAKRTHS
jgi:hypothetical protein